MWIISQDRTEAVKAISIFIRATETPRYRNIFVTCGYGSEEYYTKVGTYKKDRAEAVFELVLNALGNKDKYRMPKE